MPILLRFSLQWPVLRWKMMVCWCRGSWWSAPWFGLYPPVLLWKTAFFFIMDESFDFSVGQMWWGCCSFFPSFASWSAISFPLIPVCAGMHWRTIQLDWARSLMFSVSFFCIVSSSPDMRACRADSESVRKTAFLGFSSMKWCFLWHSAVLGLQLCSLSTVSHRELTQRMEVCLDTWCKLHILFLVAFQLNHWCRCVSRMPLDSACQSLPEPEPSKLLHSGFLSKWCQGWLSWTLHVGFWAASCLGLLFHRGVH